MTLPAHPNALRPPPPIEVAVVSHARAQSVGPKTLRTLANRGIERERVRLFVTPGQEEEYRSAVDPGIVGSIETGKFGLAAQRHYVTMAYPEGTWLVQLDDDVSDVREKVDDKNAVPVKDLESTFRFGFEACEDHKARLWGIYPVLNPMFMKNRLRVGLLFCIGHLWGVINSHDDARRVRLANKEDYERSIRYYKADGAVVRMEDIAAKTKMLGAGGLQADDQPARAALNRIEVMKLVNQWPEHVRVTKRRSELGLEIRLVE